MALKERGIDKLLEDAREDNKENDATFLGRKKCKQDHQLTLTHAADSNGGSSRCQETRESGREHAR